MSIHKGIGHDLPPACMPSDAIFSSIHALAATSSGKHLQSPSERPMEAVPLPSLRSNILTWLTPSSPKDVLSLQWSFSVRSHLDVGA